MRSHEQHQTSLTQIFHTHTHTHTHNHLSALVSVAFISTRSKVPPSRGFKEERSDSGTPCHHYGRQLDTPMFAKAQENRIKMTKTENCLQMETQTKVETRFN